MRKINLNLWSLFWTQFFGALNDNIFKNALVILITFHSVKIFGLNSEMLVALAGAIFIAPFFFLSATSGQLADIYDKTNLVKIIKTIEIVIMLLAFLAFDLKNFYLLFLILFLLGVHSSFFGPLKYALIPIYSIKSELVFSNALISGGTFVAILLGTISGGIFKGNIVKFLLLFFAILGWYFARKLPFLGNSNLSSSIVDWNFNRATKNILKLTFKNYEITKLTLGLSWFWFMGAGLLSLMPLLAKNIFHANESVATLFLFSFTLGMGIGPFILEILTKGQVKKRMIPIALLLMSIFIFDLGFIVKNSSQVPDGVTLVNFFQIDHSLHLIIDLFCLSFFGGIYTVTQFAELQLIASPDEISRVIAGNNVLNALFMVAVSLILMVFFKLAFSLWTIFIILGIFNIVVGFIQVYFYRKEFFQIS